MVPGSNDDEGIIDDAKFVTAPKQKKSDFPTVKVRGLPKKRKRRDVKELFGKLKPCSIRLPSLKTQQHIAYVSFKTEEEVERALKKSGGFYSMFSFRLLCSKRNSLSLCINRR